MDRERAIERAVIAAVVVAGGLYIYGQVGKARITPTAQTTVVPPVLALPLLLQDYQSNWTRPRRDFGTEYAMNDGVYRYQPPTWDDGQQPPASPPAMTTDDIEKMLRAYRERDRLLDALAPSAKP